MKSGKISSDKTKASRSAGLNPLSKSKKSQSSEGLNSTSKCMKGNDVKKSDLFIDKDVDVTVTDEFRTAFEKFWRTVADGVEKKKHDPIPRSTTIGNKISEMHKRIKLNQVILKNANERMKGITFAVERENFSNWKEGLSFRDPSRDDLNKFKDVKALDLEMQKLKESRPDKNVFLRNSPGIVNFHETMENTLTMLDKIQKADEMSDYDINLMSNVNLEFIKTPELVSVSDEE